MPSLSRTFLLLALSAGLLPAASISGVFVSNPVLTYGTPTDLSVSFFSTANGAGAKISGTLDSECPTVSCFVDFQANVFTSVGSTIDLVWEFTISGANTHWSMTDGGATTYASGGPGTGLFTGSTTINPGVFRFQAEAESPFTITVPNNSIDFLPAVNTAVPEPASFGLAALVLAVGATVRRRAR